MRCRFTTRRRPILAVGIVLVSTQPRTTSSVMSSRPSICAKTACEQNGAVRKSVTFSTAPVTVNPTIPDSSMYSPYTRQQVASCDMYKIHMYIIHSKWHVYIRHLWFFVMTERLSDRGLRLLQAASIKELAEAGPTDYVRWQNIKRGKARIGADEIETLARAFPSYRWWLLTGEVMPEQGQTSPDYDEANQNLSSPNAG